MSENKSVKNVPYERIFEFYANPELYDRLGDIKDVVFGKTVVFRILYFFYFLFNDLFRRKKDGMPSDPVLSDKIWVVVSSFTQEKCTGFLAEDEKFELVTAEGYEARLPAKKVNWYELSMISMVPEYIGFFYEFFKKNTNYFFKSFHIMARGIGAYENQIKVLAAYRPTAIVVANDHVPWHRSLTLAAKSLGISTIYIQHACVADNFPPLITDLALLDGQDAKDKYSNVEKKVTTKIELVGMGQYDDFSHLRNDSTKLSKLGIPYALTDDVKIVARLVMKILEEVPGLVITLRKHPRDRRSYPFNHGPNVRWSNSKEVSALEYLQTQDVIIAGESSIHLEAALMSVNSVYYLFRKGADPIDHYGFIKKGLISRFDDMDSLVDKLKNYRLHRSVDTDLIGYYVAFFNENSERTTRNRIKEKISLFLKA